jgi:hypothetical protein
VVIHRELITTLVARHRLPAIYSDPMLVRSGGLMSYSPDRVDIFRRAASYVDRILRGEKPGDLPVQQPVKFELVVNLNAAKALGLTVPDKLLIAADDVIEWKDSFAAVAHSRSWHKASEAKASEFTSAFGDQRNCMDGRPRLPSMRMTQLRHRLCTAAMILMSVLTPIKVLD